jgi:acyl-[acyl carrier protein]--UDP-N-acetylglucosamine O-acyltransferase
MSDKPTDVFDGETIELKHRGILLSCCSCGLTHMFVVLMIDGEPNLKAYRDEETTAEIREDMTLREIGALLKTFQKLRRKKLGKTNKTKSDS